MVRRYCESGPGECECDVPEREGSARRADRHQFFVEADGVRGEYIRADNAHDAKATYICKLVDWKGGE
jgi:hypothetical protein